MSVTSDGTTMVAIQRVEPQNIWIIPADTPLQSRPATTGFAHYLNASWTPDGRLIASANLTGKYELWEFNADGSSPKQITFDDFNKYEPVICGDGKYIVYVSSKSGRLNLWRTNSNGVELTQLTDMKLANSPECSADGQSVIFESNDSGHWTIWRVPIEGGKPEFFGCNDCTGPMVSPDGKYFAYESPGSGKENTKIKIRASNEDQPSRTIELPATYGGSMCWTRDGKGFTFVDNRVGSSNIYFQSVDGGEPKRLTNFDSQNISSAAWSPDGKFLAVTRGQKTTDVVKIKNGK
jgi:TolB protein